MAKRQQNTLDPKLEAEARRCADVVRRGGVILYPTDTVWGIGCDASNPQAVEKVFRLKQRADSKAMIVLVDTADALPCHAEDIPQVAYQLVEYADKPLTVIYSKGKGVAPAMLAEDGSLAIRVTAEAFSKRLCELLQRPLVSTSANISGQPTPRSFNEISREVTEGVDYVADYRRDDVTPRQPSSIMMIDGSGKFKVIRP